MKRLYSPTVKARNAFSVDTHTCSLFFPYLIARGLLLLVLLAERISSAVSWCPRWRLIIGLASWPVYQRLVTRCGGRTALAATLALLVVIVVLVVPLSLALSYAIKEASSFFAWAIAANRHGVDVPAWITSMPVLGERLAEYWLASLASPRAGRAGRGRRGEHLGNIYRMVLAATGNVFQLLLTVLFMLITLFFVYKDGNRMVAQLDVWANASCRRAGSASRASCRPPSTPPSPAWA